MKIVKRDEMWQRTAQRSPPSASRNSHDQHAHAHFLFTDWMLATQSHKKTKR